MYRQVFSARFMEWMVKMVAVYCKTNACENASPHFFSRTNLWMWVLYYLLQESSRNKHKYWNKNRLFELSQGAKRSREKSVMLQPKNSDCWTWVMNLNPISEISSTRKQAREVLNGRETSAQVREHRFQFLVQEGSWMKILIQKFLKLSVIFPEFHYVFGRLSKLTKITWYVNFTMGKNFG